MNKLLKLIFFSLIFFLVSCSTTIQKGAYPEISNKSEEVLFDDLSFNIGYDFFFLRINLFQQFYITTEDVDDGMGGTTRQKVKNYLPLLRFGFDIGNCLFVDFNGNVSLNVLSLWNLCLANDFDIEHQYQKFKKKIIVKKENNICVYWYKYKISKQKWLLNAVDTFNLINGDNFVKIKIKNVEFLSQQDQDQYFFKDLKKTFTFYQYQNGFYRLSGKTKLKYTLNNNVINIPNEMEIENYTDRIEFNIENNDATDITLKRIDNIIEAKSDLNLSKKIVVTENEISVYDYDGLDSKFVLKSFN